MKNLIENLKDHLFDLLHKTSNIEYLPAIKNIETTPKEQFIEQIEQITDWKVQFYLMQAWLLIHEGKFSELWETQFKEAI